LLPAALAADVAKVTPVVMAQVVVAQAVCYLGQLRQPAARRIQ
jgi:hypothetical protein